MRVRMGNFVYESADEDAAKTANLRDQIKSLNDQISTLVGEDPERAAGLVGQKSELEKQLVLQVGATAKAQKATQTPDQASATDRQSNIIAPDQGTPAPIADGTPVSAPSVDSDNNAVVSNDGAIVSMPQLESVLKVLGAPKRIRVGGKLFEAVSVDMPKKVRIGGYIYEAASLKGDEHVDRKTIEEIGRLLHGKHPKIDTRNGKTEIALVDDDGNEAGVLSDATVRISYSRGGGYDAVIYGNGWVAENPSEGVWRVWPGKSRTGASYRHYEVGEEFDGKKSDGWDSIEESVTREEIAVGDGAGLNHYTDTDKFSEALVDSLNSLKHRGVCAEIVDDDVILTVGEYKARLILSDATLEAYQEGPGSDIIFRYVVEDAIERTPGYTYVEETSNEGSNRVDVYSADETSELHIYIKQIKSHRPEEDGSVSSEDVID